MNRSIWTWIQLAISLSNALFLVMSHIPGSASTADIASLRVGQAESRVIAAAGQRINSSSRRVHLPL